MPSQALREILLPMPYWKENICQKRGRKDGHFAAAVYFSIGSTKHCLKGCSQGQLVFDRHVIFPIKYNVNWELTRQKIQTQINKSNIHRDSKIFDQKYKVGDEVMIIINVA